MKMIALGPSLTSDFEPQMAERYANERKNIWPEFRQMMIFWVLFLSLANHSAICSSNSDVRDDQSAIVFINRWILF